MTAKYATEAERLEARREAVRRFRAKPGYKATFNPKSAEAMRENHRSWRRQNLLAYGGSCRCCGEDNYKYLQLHHANGDGAEHAAHYGVCRGQALWNRLRTLGWPDDGFKIEVLCANCHYAITYYGGCPHEEHTDAEDNVGMGTGARQ